MRTGVSLQTACNPHEPYLHALHKFSTAGIGNWKRHANPFTIQKIPCFNTVSVPSELLAIQKLILAFMLFFPMEIRCGCVTGFLCQQWLRGCRLCIWSLVLPRVGLESGLRLLCIPEEWHDLRRRRRCFARWANSTPTLVMLLTHRAMTRRRWEGKLKSRRLWSP
jgi:hypothetical protein